MNSSFILQQLQDMDEKRISRQKHFLKNIADTEKKVSPIINKCIEGMYKAVESISPEEVCIEVFCLYNFS